MRSIAIIPAIATLALAAGAYAQLEGTVFRIENDFVDSLTDGEITYGKNATFQNNNDPSRTWKASSPAHQPGFSNSVLCDYTKYKLAPGTGVELFFYELDIQPEDGSPVAFNSKGQKIGEGSVTDFRFYIHMNTDDILAGPHDQVVVAWNNVGGFVCYPDLTGDGLLDLFDFLAYVNLFNDGDLGADCDGDNELTLFDFLCFTNAFNEGC